MPILSRLSLKEATSSSLLSKRWTSLWKFVSGLNFDAKWDMDPIYAKWVQSTMYKNWVNHVLQLYQGYTLDEFRVCFQLHGACIPDLVNWVEFAIRKRVQRLELDIGPLSISFFDCPILDYVFTFIKTPPGLSCIKSLTNLSLKCVNVTGKIIEHFLSNSPLLECLCVFKSDYLTHLHVEGPTLRLEVLELSWCISLQSIEIFAPNLVSFKFHDGGNKPRIIFKHVPNLVEVFALSWSPYAAYSFGSMLSPLSHIQTLTLAMAMEEEARIHPSQFPEQFTYLKNLTLKLLIRNTDCLFDWIVLVERAPALHRLTIQFIWWAGEYKEMNAPKCKNECLKVVDLVGFYGNCRRATSILNYLIETAIRLDTLIIDCHSVDQEGNLRKFKDKHSLEAKERALELQAKLPPSAKLVVI